ncbi:MAG: SDR family oxidoreductase [Acidobacteriota bacterium]|nr:SDR family oxidoreductase [Acidobacteriota bacterium]
MTGGVAVIGGATGTLGRAITTRLAGRGLQVVAVARGREGLDALRMSTGAVPVVADLEDDQAVATLSAAVAEAVAGAAGPVRMVVQAAGLAGGGDIDHVGGHDLASGVNRKVGGFLRLIRASAPWLAPGSRLVALGGHYGTEPSPAAPLAGVVNAGLANLARALAVRHGTDGVTVHVVAPGPVESERMGVIAARMASLRPATSTDDVLDELRGESPLGRFTHVDEVAWAVTLLLDDEAAAMTGAVLQLDAGRRKGVG